MKKKKEFKGYLKGFPKQVVKMMLHRQAEAGNPTDIGVFETFKGRDKYLGGFNWCDTSEGHDFWSLVIKYKRFDLFFEKYPKKSKKKVELCKIIYAEGKEVLFSVESIKKQDGLVIIKAK